MRDVLLGIGSLLFMGTIVLLLFPFALISLGLEIGKDIHQGRWPSLFAKG